MQNSSISTNTAARRGGRPRKASTAPAPKKNPPRRPDPAPWPESFGYVTVEMFMYALGGASVSTIYSYLRQGLLPKPDRTGLNRVGWPVEVARQALADLPAKVAALRASKSNTSASRG